MSDKQSRFEALKAAFGKKNESGSGENSSQMWDKYYPFYNMKFDETAEIRFLPDLDADNPYGFIVQNIYHVLEVNGKKRRVPCLKMYDKECPCCQKSQYYYNDVGDKALGSKFWRKIDNLAQVLVIKSPFEYEIKADDNPVRLVSIGPKLMQKIETSIAQGDFDTDPSDYDDGCDFRIIKTKQGEYASYDTSSFARRSSSVPLALRERISLYDLKTFRIPEMETSKIESLIDAMLTGKSNTSDMNQSNHGTQDANTMLASLTNQDSVGGSNENASVSGSSDPASKAAAILAKLKASNGQ